MSTLIEKSPLEFSPIEETPTNITVRLTGVSSTSYINNTIVTVIPKTTGLVVTSMYGHPGILIDKTITGLNIDTHSGTLVPEIIIKSLGLSITANTGELYSTVDLYPLGLSIISHYGNMGKIITTYMTGLSITSHINLITNISISLIGQYVNSHVGTPGYEIFIPLDGQYITVAAGIPLAVKGITIIGESSTISLGQLNHTIIPNISGQYINSHIGTLTIDGLNYLSGLFVNSEYDLPNTLIYPKFTGLVINSHTGILIYNDQNNITGLNITSQLHTLDKILTFRPLGQTVLSHLGELTVSTITNLGITGIPVITIYGNITKFIKPPIMGQQIISHINSFALLINEHINGLSILSKVGNILATNASVILLQGNEIISYCNLFTNELLGIIGQQVNSALTSFARTLVYTSGVESYINYGIILVQCSNVDYNSFVAYYFPQSVAILPAYQSPGTYLPEGYGISAIIAIQNIYGGSNYTDVPHVSIPGYGKATAILIPTSIDAAQVDKSGHGYFGSSPVPLFFSSSGSGAQGISTLKLVDLIIYNPGHDYLAGDIIILADGIYDTPAIIVIDKVREGGGSGRGQVLWWHIENSGSYTQTPTEPTNTISTNNPLGNGFTLYPIWGINTVSITNGGMNYATRPHVLLPGGSSVVNSILSPTSVASYVVDNPGKYLTPPPVTVSGNATATAILGVNEEQRLLSFIEYTRQFILDITSLQEGKRLQIVLGKIKAALKFGLNPFDGAFLAQVAYDNVIQYVTPEYGVPAEQRLLTYIELICDHDGYISQIETPQEAKKLQITIARMESALKFGTPPWNPVEIALVAQSNAMGYFRAYPLITKQYPEEHPLQARGEIVNYYN